MTRDPIIEPTDTLRDAIRYAENIKIAYELIKEKSPDKNKTLTYLLRNLGLDIDALLELLYDAMKIADSSTKYESTDHDDTVDENLIKKDEKVV